MIDWKDFSVAIDNSNKTSVETSYIPTSSSTITVGSGTGYSPATTTTISYPVSSTWPIAAMPVSGGVCDDGLEEKIKKYTNKVDEHIDELEEDIEFLNKKREELEKNFNAGMSTISESINDDRERITELETRSAAANSPEELTFRMIALEELCKKLESDNERLTNFTNYLLSRIDNFEGKIENNE